MPRYFLHLRDLNGRLIEDDEGSEFSNLSAARVHAVQSAQEIVAATIKSGQDLEWEAIVVADEHGSDSVAVPLVAALPPKLIGLLKQSDKVIAAGRFEEYRRNADGCRHKAENTDDVDDKTSWLKLADAWLQMLPPVHDATGDAPGWPKPSSEDSKASH